MMVPKQDMFHRCVDVIKTTRAGDRWISSCWFDVWVVEVWAFF